MEVILLADLNKVGDKYDVVTVKNGFGRNYLIPKKMALIANETNMQRLADLKAKEAAEEAKKVGVYQEMAEKLKGKVLKIGAKAGTSGKIFGSVTGIQLSAALKDQFEVEIPRKKIVVPDDVKELGTYTAALNLHPDVVSSIEFEVIKE